MGRKLKHDLLGNTFGDLTVIARTDQPEGLSNRQTYWICRCQCGNQKTTTTQALLRAKNPPSCGCSRTSGNIKNRKYEDPRDVTLNSIESQYKANATRRNLCWKIDQTYFRKLIASECHYCGEVPQKTYNVYKRKHKHRNRASREWSELATVYANGIDRKDNTKGYTPHNCVSCCEKCNKAKRNMTYQEFIKWIQNLARNVGRL